MLKNFLFSLSLANLCYIRVWSALLTKKSYFFLVNIPTKLDIYAIMINVIILATFFWVIITFIQSRKKEWLNNFSIICFFFLLFIPANAVRNVLTISPLDLISIQSQIHPSLKMMIIILIIITIIFFSKLLVRFIVFSILIFFPLIFFTFGNALFILPSLPQHINVDQRQKTPKNSFNNQQNKVLVFIFDEMDQRITFLGRPKSLRLDEIDFWKNQSLFAQNAYPPGRGTTFSIPSYILGKILTTIEPIDSLSLGVGYSNAQKKIDWASVPNLFSAIHDLGFSSAVIGWHNPYCRAFSDYITECIQYPSENIFQNFGDNLTSKMAYQILILWPGYSRLIHSYVYSETLKNTKHVINDAKFNFILVHWPIPHPPGIFDRSKRRISLNNFSIVDGYLDNLQLVNETLKDIRENMEKGGLWDNTTIILTSDHWWRGSISYNGELDYRIPFILKLPNQKIGTEYEPKFNTVILKDLIINILNSKIRNSSDLINWLNNNSNADAIPYEKQLELF